MRAKAARGGRTTRNHEEIRALIATVTSRDAEIGPILQRPLQHVERMTSAVDSDGSSSVDFVHGHPWLSTPMGVV